LIVNSEARGMTHNDLHRNNIMLDSKSMTLRIIDYGRITLPSVQVANYRQSRMFPDALYTSSIKTLGVTESDLMSIWNVPPFLGSDFNGRYRVCICRRPYITMSISLFFSYASSNKFDVEKMFDFNFDTGYPYSEPRILPS
jgi:thiamine kinase-like enzyme